LGNYAAVRSALYIATICFCLPDTVSAADKAGQKPNLETATLAGGCFWGMQELLRKIPGVVSTRVGYTGGWLEGPKYEDTHDSKSGHAESVEIVFDPSKLSFEELLEKWFFRMHDPTTLNRQGNDVGTQYRSAILVHSEAQRRTAERVKEKISQSGKWKRPIVTEIVNASTFWSAEDYHQDYLQKHPNGYTCHYMRE
jgi:methionine-S-sulfoxide reductase